MKHFLKYFAIAFAIQVLLIFLSEVLTIEDLIIPHVIAILMIAELFGRYIPQGPFGVAILFGVPTLIFSMIIALIAYVLKVAINSRR